MAFVMVVQPTASVLRAAVMGALALLAVLAGRRRQAIPVLSAAVLALLVAAPAVGCRRRVRAVGVGHGRAGGDRPDLVGAPGRARLPKALADAVCIALAAQVVTAPLIAAISGQLSLIGVLGYCRMSLIGTGGELTLRRVAMTCSTSMIRRLRKRSCIGKVPLRLALQDASVDADLASGRVRQHKRGVHLLGDRIPGAVREAHLGVVLAIPDVWGEGRERDVVLEVGGAVGVGNPLETGLVAVRGPHGLPQPCDGAQQYDSGQRFYSWFLSFLEFCDLLLSDNGFRDNFASTGQDISCRSGALPPDPTCSRGRPVVIEHCE